MASWTVSRKLAVVLVGFGLTVFGCALDNAQGGAKDDPNKTGETNGGGDKTNGVKGSNGGTKNGVAKASFVMKGVK